MTGGRRLVAGTAIFLVLLVWLAIRPYGGNISALLRIESRYAAQYDLPHGLVLFEDSGYDGMLYHQMAREIPAMLRGEAPVPLRGQARPDRAYRWQRVLLPLTAWAVTAGHTEALPWAFAWIDIAAVLAALALLVSMTGKAGVHALSLALNPAALIGILFSLTEPLSLLLATAFLWLWKRQGERVTAAQVVVLGLGIFAREVNVFLVAALVLYLASRRRWGEAAASAAAVLPFAAWQVALWMRFGALPLAGNPVFGLPFAGCAQMLRGLSAGDMHGLSAAAFLLCFAAPLLVLVVATLASDRRPRLPTFALACFTLTLFCLNAEMWEAITAIGRVLPALYPVYALAASDHDTPAWKALSTSLCAVSVVGAVGVALTLHPFVLS